MTYRCIIVEDNAIERDLMEVLLAKVDGAEVVGIFENGLAALQFLQTNPVDIAFTDIDMPELSGIGLLKSLRHPPAFVFISAHDGYAADGYELDAIDFIRKPVVPERLFRAFAKARLHLEQQQAEQLVPDRSGQAIPEGNPAPTPAPQPEAATLMVRTSEGIHKLKATDIAYAESKGNYSQLHLAAGQELMVLISLRQLEEQLPPETFVRIHKHYLVNWAMVDLIRKESVTLLDGRYEVPIGDSHRKTLMERVAGHRALER